MKILISHPTSNQNNRYSLQALSEKKILLKFVTSVNFDITKYPLKVFPRRLKSFLNKRSFKSINKEKIITNSLLTESIRYLKNKILNIHDTYKLYNDIDLLTASFIKKNKSNINAVYCYEDCAYNTFIAAKNNNIKCIYELPIGYWREKDKILKKENKFYKNFKIPLNIESIEKLKRKDLELKYADIIVVPSLFVKKTLLKSKLKKKKIIVIPYSFPEPKKKVNWYNKNKKLELLYVGSLTPRKGLYYLSKAIKKLYITDKDKFTLTIIGSGPLEKWLKKELPNAIFKKNLPHNIILKEMQSKDVLIFPSLFEGFGLVITEAMSRGMVVMSTNRTILPEIRGKNNSVLIRNNNSNDIVNNVRYFFKYPHKAKIIGQNATLACRNNSWFKYKKNFINMTNKIHE